MQHVYALIDCNNFFVSCERLFRPDLEGRPVVVLSSNDGCAVSRSREAKDLGIPMGAPLFKFRDMFRQHGVVAFSANFELYGDISERITNTLASITPHIEVYSVDESFLDLSELNITDYQAWGHTVRGSILKQVGVPVSIGIATSKTLAKLAVSWAKNHPETGGVTYFIPTEIPEPVILSEAEGSSLESGRSFDSASGSTQDDTVLMKVLSKTPVRDIWGVGWKLAPKLRAEGVHTALDLRCMSPKRAQQLMGIHGRHMVYELNGTDCLPLQHSSKPQQMIMRGRQFGEDTREFYVIESAIASLAARAGVALRREHQLARRATVVLRTNRHKPGYQEVRETVRLYTPTADTGLLCSQLVSMLGHGFNSQLAYHRADVLLHDLVPETGLQTDLLGLVVPSTTDRSKARLEAVDALNARYGKNHVHYAAEDLSRAWQPRRNLSSPRYTSAWPELPEAKLV